MVYRYFAGIDTSAYTTSLAIIDCDNNIVMDLRRMLQVKRQEKGLRQQEAVFQHINNLPLLIDIMTKEIDITKINAISCSGKPRQKLDSYMPVFIVGKNQASILSKVLRVDYFEYSHQEGHIAVGMINSSIKDKQSFLSIHISGGTTELLLVKNTYKGISVDIIGGTLDLSIGQLIDRIGVELGLEFPCGKGLDLISRNGYPLPLRVPISLKSETWFNISGLENYFKGLITSSSYSIEDILATLFNTIAIILCRIIANSCKQHKLDQVLVTGGVAANTFIREYLLQESDIIGINILFPNTELCTDNGVGVAYLGKEKYLVGDKNGF